MLWYWKWNSSSPQTEVARNILPNKNVQKKKIDFKFDIRYYKHAELAPIKIHGRIKLLNMPDVRVFTVTL